MINPPDRRYPGPGRPPTPTDQARYMRAVDALQQGNPADGGTAGIGVDSGGTQFRDWSSKKILARITSHGTDNAYGWEEVFVDETGAVDTVSGGLSGDDTDNPAYEVNDSATVAVNTVVELWPNFSPEPYWSFTAGGAGGSSTLVATVYAIADLSTSPPTYTVREVYRDGSGVLTDVAGPVNYTAYEGNNRQAFIDTAGTPTREYPLFRDSAGKYYFEIEQYADGSASPALPGQVSTTTQVISGLKKLIDREEVYNRLTVGNTIASPGDKFTVDITSATAGTLVFGRNVGTNFGSFVTQASSGQYPSAVDGNLYVGGGLYLAQWPGSAADQTYVELIPGAITGGYITGSTWTYSANGTDWEAILAGQFGGDADGNMYAAGGGTTTFAAFYQDAGPFAILNSSNGPHYGLTAAGGGGTSAKSFLDADGITNTVYIDGGIIFRWDQMAPFVGNAGGGAAPMSGLAGPPYIGGGPKVGGGPQEQFESGTGPEE